MTSDERRVEPPIQCGDGPISLIEDTGSAQQEDIRDSVTVHRELDHPILRELLTGETADYKQLQEDCGIVSRQQGKSARKRTTMVQCKSEKQPMMTALTVRVSELEHWSDGDGDGSGGCDSGLSVAPCGPVQVQGSADGGQIITRHSMLAPKRHLMLSPNGPSSINTSVLEKGNLRSATLYFIKNKSSHDAAQLPLANLPTVIRGLSFDNGRFIDDTEKALMPSTTLPTSVSELSSDNDIVIDTGQVNDGSPPIPLEVLKCRFDEDTDQFLLDEPPPAKKFCH